MSGYWDIFIVIVPIVMIFIDVLIIKKGRELQQWYFAGYLIVTIFSMYVGFIALLNTVLVSMLPSIFIPSPIALQIMQFLSYGVMIVSFIQMFVLIHLTRPSKLKEEIPEEDLWLFGTNHDALGEQEDEGVLQ